MRTAVEKLIRGLGTVVKIRHEGKIVNTVGIFMPTTSRSWQNMQNVYSELGEAPRGQYNYIGCMEPVVEKGDLLDVGDRRYLMRRAEVIYDSRGPLYRWGLCVERGREDAWSDLD